VVTGGFRGQGWVANINATKEPPMTDEMTGLRALVE
jgi:hypothetical protein